MIEKFAIIPGHAPSEFHDLNRTSKLMFLVSLMMPKFARYIAAASGELRHRDTSAMIEKFAIIPGRAPSEFHDLNRASNAARAGGHTLACAFGSSERTRISSSGH